MMFTSAARSNDAEASRPALPDGAREIGVGIKTGATIGVDVGVDVDVCDVLVIGGGTFFLGTGTGRACDDEATVADFDSKDGAVIGGNVRLGNTERVEEAFCVTGATVGITVTLPKKTMKMIPRTTTAVVPRYCMIRGMCIRYSKNDIIALRGTSLMVEQVVSNHLAGVRFSRPALTKLL
jgi:hypothetical protein